MDSTNNVLDRVHMSAIWRIPLISPCSALIWAVTVIYSHNLFFYYKHPPFLDFRVVPLGIIDINEESLMCQSGGKVYGIGREQACRISRQGMERYRKTWGEMRRKQRDLGGEEEAMKGRVMIWRKETCFASFSLL